MFEDKDEKIEPKELPIYKGFKPLHLCDFFNLFPKLYNTFLSSISNIAGRQIKFVSPDY